MNKYIIKIISILVLFIVIISTHYSCYAENEKIDVDILGGTIQDEFDPSKGVSGVPKKLAQPFTNVITTVVNSILGIIQILGGLLTIVSIAIYGFYMVAMSNGPLAHDLGIGGGRNHSPETKKQVLDFGRHLIIGSILLFGSTSLVRFVFNIFT